MFIQKIYQKINYIALGDFTVTYIERPTYTWLSLNLFLSLCGFYISYFQSFKKLIYLQSIYNCELSTIAEIHEIAGIAAKPLTAVDLIITLWVVDNVLFCFHPPELLLVLKRIFPSPDFVYPQFLVPLFFIRIMFRRMTVSLAYIKVSLFYLMTP